MLEKGDSIFNGRKVAELSKNGDFNVPFYRGLDAHEHRLGVLNSSVINSSGGSSGNFVFGDQVVVG